MNSPRQPQRLSLPDLLWDAWCVCSLIGIWPRFIEPNLITTSYITLKVPKLPKELHGLRILQFSDLHLHPRVPDFFLKHLCRKINRLKPDLIVFTGDFLCFSVLAERERLMRFLSSLQAPYGCYAVLGNHDYQQSVSINDKGEYDVIENSPALISKGFSRLFTTTTLAKKVALRAQAVGQHAELTDLLKKTPFQLLHNQTKLISIKNKALNICGLGEYTLGRLQPEIAFKDYDRQYPGIILAHNPDSIPFLEAYPGEVILCGHTHGGQVNLPWLWKKFTLLENMQFKKGLHKVKDKWAYINRGIGSVLQFRWFSPPEILLLTLASTASRLN